MYIFSLNQQSQDFEIRYQLSMRGHSKDNTECLCEHPSEEHYYEYTANPECPVTGHSGAVIGVALSADGQWLVSGSDTSIRLWDARPGGATVVSAV